jgi:hypothetical protein
MIYDKTDTSPVKRSGCNKISSFMNAVLGLQFMQHYTNYISRDDVEYGVEMRVYLRQVLKEDRITFLCKYSF